MGVRDKAENSNSRTQALHESANRAQDTVNVELEPQLARAKADLTMVEEKTRVTKQAVEVISK